MIRIDTEGKTGKELYPLLTSAVVPRPIAWVSTLGEEGQLNVAPFSYFNLVSTRPPILMISVGEREGVPKDTARNILREKEFVVHIVSHPWLHAMNETAIEVDASISEADLVGLTPVASTHLKTPGIKEALVRFECTYDQHINYPHSTLLFGKIKAIHVDETVLQNNRIDIKTLHPVARLGGVEYSTLGDVIKIARPKGDPR